MRFYDAIDLYIADMRTQGRLNSPSSERGYRSTLLAHAEDVGNRDPTYVGREDVKCTLRRWPNANTQGTNRSKLVSFYDWTMEEGLRKDNPARQTGRPRRRSALKYRLTEHEALAVLTARVSGERSSWACALVCGMPSSVDCRGVTSRGSAWCGCRLTSRRVAASGGCRSSRIWHRSRMRSARASVETSTCCQRSGLEIRPSTPRGRICGCGRHPARHCVSW
jgi:hypothetical protein